MTGSTQSVVEWLDRSAVQYPDKCAIEEAGGRGIRYDALADLSSRLQARLVAVGVRRGDRVGLFMRKSIDTLIAFHAVLRSGAAYVPADPLAPVSRAALMISDCEAAVVIVDEELAEPLRAELVRCGYNTTLLVVPAARTVGDTWRIEALVSSSRATPVATSADDLAFLLYTSGSTGRPKAVMLTHRNVVTFIDWCSIAFAPNADDRFALHAPLQFSLGVFNLYVAWKHGGTVVLLDERLARVPEVVAPLMARCRITVWFSTPTILSLLAQSGQLRGLSMPSLRLVMFAGEPFPIPTLQSLMQQLPGPQYVHILGSTETHIIARHRIANDFASRTTTSLPIGQVCEHFRSRILNDAGEDAPAARMGELCLSGPAVTAGYWRSPEATARAFFVDSEGVRWYRTGDIVCVLPDGNLQYRGRRDRMVKKRGYRIELAEIEACLSGHGGVLEAAVVAKTDKRRITVNAFVVPSANWSQSIIDIKAHCAKSLPSYMVPDTVTFTPALPRTTTGKIDLLALRDGS